MAKMKTYAVTVEYTVSRTYYVAARKPGGAKERILSDEGWAEATRFDSVCEDPNCGGGTPFRPPKSAVVTDVRSD